MSPARCLFSEPMQVETVRANGAGVWSAGLVGQQTERFRPVTLTADEIASLTVADTALAYDRDGCLLRASPHTQMSLAGRRSHSVDPMQRVVRPCLDGRHTRR